MVIEFEEDVDSNIFVVRNCGFQDFHWTRNLEFIYKVTNFNVSLELHVLSSLAVGKESCVLHFDYTQEIDHLAGILIQIENLIGFW